MSYVVNPRSVKRAKNLIALHPEWFEALEIYDQTGKLPRISTKVRVNFTIDEELHYKFRQQCNAKGLKMSQVIENKIREFLKEKQ